MFDIKIMLYSPEEDYEECAWIGLKLYKWEKIINLPPWVFPGVKVTRNYGDSEYQDLVHRAYGFWYMHDDYYYLVINYGIQDEHWESIGNKRWSWSIPWLDWTHVRHTIYRPNGDWFAEIDGIEWDDREKTIAACPKIRFQIRDFDGEIVDATAYLEEMEWQRGRGWWRWVKHVAKPKIRRSIDIRYAAEVGLGKQDNWKGGTIGHGVDIEPGESIADALGRLYTTHPNYANTSFLVDTLELECPQV